MKKNLESILLFTQQISGLGLGIMACIGTVFEFFNPPYLEKVLKKFNLFWVSEHYCLISIIFLIVLGTTMVIHDKYF